MKATHTARVIDIEGLVKGLPCSLDKERFYFFNEIAESEITLEIDKDKYFKTGYHTAFLLTRSDLTDIREIKPEVEIPDTPFWLSYGSVNFSKVVVHKSHHNKLTFENTGNSYSIEEFKYLLKVGVWKIIPKPEPKMRAFNDAEWKEWFLNDGVVITKGSNCIQRMSKIALTDEKEFIYNHMWTSKESFLRDYTDRNGNPFTKEVN